MNKKIKIGNQTAAVTAILLVAAAFLFAAAPLGCNRGDTTSDTPGDSNSSTNSTRSAIDSLADGGTLGSGRLEKIFVKSVGGFELVVGVARSTGYMPKNEHRWTGDTGVSLSVWFVGPSGQLEQPTAGFISVNGKPEAVTMTSSNPEVIEIYDQDFPIARGAGDAVVQVHFAGSAIPIPVKVHELPFSLEAKDRELVELLGLPQRKYGPNNPEDGLLEFWEYDSLPGLVIAMHLGDVDEIQPKKRADDFKTEVVRLD